MNSVRMPQSSCAPVPASDSCAGVLPGAAGFTPFPWHRAAHFHKLGDVSEIPKKLVSGGTGLATLRRWLAEGGAAVLELDDGEAEPMVLLTKRLYEALVEIRGLLASGL
jgi:hypothetical protein